MPSIALAQHDQMDGSVQGLLDLAFDPEFDSNNFFYLSFTVNLGTDVSSSDTLARCRCYSYKGRWCC